MTLEELKKEADALGYKLIKKTEYVRHMKCKCGGHGRVYYVWYYDRRVIIKCDHCKTEGSYQPSERKAWIAWNEMQSKE